MNQLFGLQHRREPSPDLLAECNEIQMFRSHAQIDVFIGKSTYYFVSHQISYQKSDYLALDRYTNTSINP